MKSKNDMVGSHGFCLLNNVAIGAAYARCLMRGTGGVQKVAIVDFDVHVSDPLGRLHSQGYTCRYLSM